MGLPMKANVTMPSAAPELTPEFAAHSDAWQALEPLIHQRAFHKEDVILHHGDAATALWVVYRGWVKLTRQTPDGKETIVGLCTEGDVFGEAALFPHANYPYHAEVVGADALLASIPAEALRGLIARDKALARGVMTMLNTRLAQAQLKLEHVSTLSAAQRLGCFLLRLCHTETAGGKTLQIPVEKHILAAYLGMKPETLSRSQQQLKPVGVEVSGQSVTVNDVAQLREFVCNSCSESGACDVEASAGE